MHTLVMKGMARLYRPTEFIPAYSTNSLNLPQFILTFRSLLNSYSSTTTTEKVTSMADNTFGRVNYLKISRQEKTLGVKFEARKVSWFMSGGENL